MKKSVISPVLSPAQRSLEPTDTEMKEALLREMEKFGFQREGANSVVINNPIAGMTIRIERRNGCGSGTDGVLEETSSRLTKLTLNLLYRIRFAALD